MAAHTTHNSLFTAEQLQMIETYLQAYTSSSFQADRSATNWQPKAEELPPNVPLFDGKQLQPMEMVAEAKHLLTNHLRRAQLLDALTRGYEVMRAMAIPAYRMLFVQ